MTASQRVMTDDDVVKAVRVLLDEREIRKVIVRYVHASDRLDDEELATVYQPGAYDHHGPIKGDEQQYRAAMIESLRNHFTLCSHTLGQTNFVSYDGERACTETYVFAVTGREVDGRESLAMGGGRYIDKFEKRNGQWRIADRVYVPDWDTEVDRSRWLVAEEWIQAARDRSDLSYFGLQPFDR